MASEPTSPTAPIRVLVVDDAVAVRRLMTMLFQSEPELELAGIAQDGLVALEKIALLKPDIISLDLAMPNMDGLTMLREMRDRRHRRPGDHVQHAHPPRGEGDHRGSRARRCRLRHQADALRQPDGRPRGGPCRTGAAHQGDRPQRPACCTRWHRHRRRQSTDRCNRESRGPTAPGGARGGKVEAIVIGSSTGGPNALAEVIVALPGNLRVPVLVAQHMPPVYTTYLAQRLDSLSALSVREAVDGEPVVSRHRLHRSGRPPSDASADRRRAPRSRSSTSAPVNHCRPSVDVLFRAPHRCGASTPSRSC